MVNCTSVRTRAWWRLSGLEILGVLLGAGTGLVSAAPLLWLALEAEQLGNVPLLSTAGFQSWELLVLWAGSALVGGYLAANLTRYLSALNNVAAYRWVQYLLHLCVGVVIIMLLAPLPVALLLGPWLGGIVQSYVVGGGLVGWQSGVIAFVFLYTFRTLEQIRHTRESGP